jgi:hypothetical protein
MHKQWIGCAPQNFRKGRPAGSPPAAVVLHVLGGPVEEIDKKFADPASALSAHYAVARDGRVHQYVEESDTAFHAGVVVSPTWKLLKPGINPNFSTIGIVREGSAAEPCAAAQFEVLAALLAEVAARWSIALDAEHVALHSEIRASADCPGRGLDRDALIRRAVVEAAAAARPLRCVPFETEIRVVANTNLREGSPFTSARICRVLPANSTASVTAFTSEGERVLNNSYWYQAEDGNFFWAGATDTPHPVAPEPPRPVVVAPVEATPAAVCACGISRIDTLFTGGECPPIVPGDPDRDAVGAIQDLLTGLGFSGLPGVLSTAYGSFGRKTTAALCDFQARHELPTAEAVDAATLKQLVCAPAPDPRATRIYLSLVLGVPYSGMHKVLSLVAQMEGVGKFAALNLNTDKAGLSFGLIQWAQRPGRLGEILEALSRVNREEFVRIFGGGDPAAADRLVAHVRRPSGGVDPQTGVASDSTFNLVAEPWTSRFRKAALLQQFQRVQVDVAVSAFTRSYQRIRQYASAIRSERGIAFMIDVANQFGDLGAQRLYTAVHRPGMDEMDVLEDVAAESVNRMPDRFKMGVRARRDGFLNTPLLSDSPFELGQMQATAGT